jgi:hypothetical protein
MGMKGETQHKMTGTPTWRSWQAMKQRCRDKNCKDYEFYGARGVKVCARWSSFKNFFADMGLRPEGATLDRKDSTGNYEPSNCRWADKFQQKHNRTDNIQLEFKGKTQPLAVWARELEIHFETLRHRLRRGWTVEEAFTTKAVKSNGATSLRGK